VTKFPKFITITAVSDEDDYNREEAQSESYREEYLGGSYKEEGLGGSYREQELSGSDDDRDEEEEAKRANRKSSRYLEKALTKSGEEHKRTLRTMIRKWTAVWKIQRNSPTKVCR
jgi:hypothetical protein